MIKPQQHKTQQNTKPSREINQRHMGNNYTKPNNTNAKKQIIIPNMTKLDNKQINDTFYQNSKQELRKIPQRKKRLNAKGEIHQKQRKWNNILPGRKYIYIRGNNKWPSQNKRRNRSE